MEWFYPPLLKHQLALLLYCGHQLANKQTRSAVQTQACLKKEISGPVRKRGTKCGADAEQINAAPQFVDKHRLRLDTQMSTWHSDSKPIAWVGVHSRGCQDEQSAQCG